MNLLLAHKIRFKLMIAFQGVICLWNFAIIPPVYAQGTVDSTLSKVLREAENLYDKQGYQAILDFIR